MKQHISNLLEALKARSPRDAVQSRHKETLFLSVSDGRSRARTVQASGASLDDAGQRLLDLAGPWHGIDPCQLWVRMDRADQVLQVTWGQAQRLLQETKTNYFSFGLAWDKELEIAHLPEELWGHACLYAGNIDQCQPHAENLSALSKSRRGVPLEWPSDAQEPIWLFSTRGAFLKDGEPVQHLANEGSLRGLRELPALDADTIRAAIHSSADYLTRQVSSSGHWIYGRYPCFDRHVPSYNVLRYATAALSLLDAWDVTHSQDHLMAAQRALNALCEDHIHPLVTAEGRNDASYLVDVGDEVKSGGNGVAIVALAKLIEITGEQRYVVTVRALAEGLLLLQSQDDGAFPHVMRFPTMQLVERHRTIYYDGEALFGLLKAFEVTKDSRYLEAARRAANHFVRLEHWRAHDHWLAYGLNELTRYEHDKRFFLLALRNVGRHVRFVKERLTAYPTLLELCMASLQTVSRMKSMGVQPRQIDSGFSEAEVLEALHMRAKKLFSAHMFPELAMFFRSPGDIVGSFAIRHYSFRIRIDDVQHFICGLVSYYREFLHDSSGQRRRSDCLMSPGHLSVH